MRPMSCRRSARSTRRTRRGGELLYRALDDGLAIAIAREAGASQETVKRAARDVATVKSFSQRSWFRRFRGGAGIGSRGRGDRHFV